jgi:tetratricopeptide (TPR) repeat protein
MLNQAALHMLDSLRPLPVALDVAKHAVRVAEKASLDIDVKDLRPTDETYISTIADYWTTLGRAQAKLGSKEDAEKTLLSAWKLTQSGLAAFYLCQLYDSENKTQAALQMCKLAHSRLPQESVAHLSGLTQLIEQNDALLMKLNPNALNTFDMATSEHIANMRDLKLPHVYTGQATARYLLQVDFDPQSNSFKVTGSKFVSGSDKLKPFASALTKLNLSLSSPDGNPVRVIRGGTFLCGGGDHCEFLLNDANLADRSIPINVVH